VGGRSEFICDTVWVVVVFVFILIAGGPVLDWLACSLSSSGGLSPDLLRPSLEGWSMGEALPPLGARRLAPLTEESSEFKFNWGCVCVVTVGG
jgi:hypothetical protein